MEINYSPLTSSSEKHLIQPAKGSSVPQSVTDKAAKYVKQIFLSIEQAEPLRLTLDSSEELTDSESLGYITPDEKELQYPSSYTATYESEELQDSEIVESDEPATPLESQKKVNLTSLEGTQAKTPSSESVVLTKPLSWPEMLELAKYEMKQSVEFLKLNISPESVHLSHKRFTNLGEQIDQYIEKLEFQRISELIESEGYLYAALAQKDARRIVLNLNNHRVIFSPSGKIYAEVGQIGKTGGFKTTFKVILIGSTQINHLGEKLKIRAFGMLHEDRTSEYTEDEKQLNLYLKGLSKTEDLSHVHLIKSITPVNEKQMGIMSKVRDGDVDSLLAKKALTEEERLDIAYQMAKAVGQLHGIDVVHRDIKSDNFLFLLDDQNKVFVKIADFGTSSRLDPDKKSSVKKFYTRFTDPYAKDKFEKSIDIFQLGMTLGYTIAGLSLFEFEERQDEETAKIKEANPRMSELACLRSWKMNPANWSILQTIQDESTRKMLMRMVDDPKNRPSIEEVISFFEKHKIR